MFPTFGGVIPPLIVSTRTYIGINISLTTQLKSMQMPRIDINILPLHKMQNQAFVWPFHYLYRVSVNYLMETAYYLFWADLPWVPHLHFFAGPRPGMYQFES